jgi:hypothetical protein
MAASISALVFMGINYRQKVGVPVKGYCIPHSVPYNNIVVG